MNARNWEGTKVPPGKAGEIWLDLLAVRDVAIAAEQMKVNKCLHVTDQIRRLDEALELIHELTTTEPAPLFPEKGRTKFPLHIVFRKLLQPAVLAFDEQKNLFVHQVVILVADQQPPEEQRISLFHEMLHVMLCAAGIPAPHDEKWVEERAVAMAQACPDILEKMGRK